MSYSHFSKSNGYVACKDDRHFWSYDGDTWYETYRDQPLRYDRLDDGDLVDELREMFDLANGNSH